jgi:hypothetical protein
MTEHDISCEISRTYTVLLPMLGQVYRKTITQPKKLFYEKGHSFHRIWDGFQVFLMPAPGLIEIDGMYGFVEMTWVPQDDDKPCNF